MDGPKWWLQVWLGRHHWVSRVFSAAKWFVWDFSGIRAISKRLITPKDPDTGKRMPVTLFLWIVGIYVALFGVASQRYENRVDIIENRMNAIFTQLATPIYKKALNKISHVQWMPCPQRPDIKSPASIFPSHSPHHASSKAARKSVSQNGFSSITSV